MLALLALCLGGVGRGAAAQDAPSEQSLRAAMTFNFLKFAELPADSIAGLWTVRLCLAVSDPMQAAALEELAGRRLWGRELAVVRYAGAPGDCQALYVDSRQRWGSLADQRMGAMLTVSAYPGFAREGGMVEIAADAGGTRFDINLAAARRAGIRLSPQLLRLARHVHE